MAHGLHPGYSKCGPPSAFTGSSGEMQTPGPAPVLLIQNLHLVLCDNVEGWDGVGGGGEAQERGDICVPMANSCWHMAETNTIL